MKSSALDNFQVICKHKVDLMEIRGIKRLEFSFGGVKYEIVKNENQEHIYDVNEYTFTDSKILEFPSF